MRLYETTDAGREALRGWLEEREGAGQRNLFLLKLFFAAHADRSLVRAHILERREEAQRLQQEIAEMSDSPDLDDFFHALTRDYGHAVADAVVRWSDRALAALDALDQERSER